MREDSAARLGSKLGKVVEAGELRNVVRDLQQPRHVADRVVQPLQAVAAPRAALYRRVASQEGALQRRMPYEILPTFPRKSWSCVIRQAAPARHLATPDAACKHTAARRSFPPQRQESYMWSHTCFKQSTSITRIAFQ